MKLTFNHIRLKFQPKDLIFLLYIFSTLLVAGYHEMWRDEAQKWLIARDTSFIDIFTVTRYEGHPFVWYYALKVLQLFGLPYASVQYLNLFIVYLGAGIFWFKSPFSLVFKSFFLFSTCLHYEFSIISINYGIVFTLMMWLAYASKEGALSKTLWIILLFVLVNSHIMAFAFSVSVCIMLFWDAIQKRERAFVICLGIFAVFSLFFLWFQLRKPENGVFGGEPLADWHMGLLSKGFVKIFDSTFCFYNINLPWYLGLALIVGGIAVISQKRALWILLPNLAFFFAINEFVYGLSFRHYCFLYLIFIYCWWVYGLKTSHLWHKSYIWLSTVLMFHTAFYSLRYLENEIKYPFSGSKECATFINENIDTKNSILVGLPSFAFSAVIPYINENIKFWQPETNQMGSYILWTKEWHQNYFIGMDSTLAHLYLRYGKQKNIYLFANKDRLLAKTHSPYRTKLIYQPNENVFSKPDEIFWIYKLE